MAGPQPPSSDLEGLALPAQITHSPCPEMVQSI